MDRTSKKKWWDGRGFYIALALCALVIGVTTYIAARQVLKTGDELTQTETPAQSADDAQSASNRVEGITEEPPVTVTPPAAEPEAEPEPEAEETWTEPETEAVPTLNQIVQKPVWQLPAQGELMRPYSGDELVWSVTMDDWRTHDGVDLLGGEDGAVCAAADGTVVEVSSDTLMGCTVVLEHENGIRTRYRSLAEDGITVAPGDFVERGAAIGKVGQSAIAECLDEPHVHFEVLKDDKPVDPMEYLEA